MGVFRSAWVAGRESLSKFLSVMRFETPVEIRVSGYKMSSEQINERFSSIHILRRKVNREHMASKEQWSTLDSSLGSNIPPLTSCNSKLVV